MSRAAAHSPHTPCSHVTATAPVLAIFVSNTNDSNYSISINVNQIIIYYELVAIKEYVKSSQKILITGINQKRDMNENR